MSHISASKPAASHAGGALSRGEIFAYCVYAVPLIATTAAVSSFVPAYYSSAFAMPLTLVASCLLAIRLIDAVIDPFIGLAIDNSGFRQKHRPWLLISLPLYVAAAALLFMPLPSLVGPAYLIIIGSLVYIAFTIGMVVHQAWAASLSTQPLVLSRLFGYREVAVIAGVLGVFVLAAAAGKLFSGDISAQARAAGLFIVVSITLCTAITYLFTPDQRHGDTAHDKTPWAELRPFLASRNFVLICLAILVYNGAWTAMATTGFFIAENLYNAADSYALAMAITFGIAPFGMALWMRLARRIGDQATMRIAALAMAAIALSLPFATRFGTNGLFAFQALMGLCFGAGPYLLRSLTGILANAYIARTHYEVRGAGFAMTNFFDKLGSGLGAGALLPLALLGFDPAAGVDDTGRQVLLVMGTAFPVVCFLLTALLVHVLRGLEGAGAAAAGDASS